MHINNRTPEPNHDFLVERYKQGIRLARPEHAGRHALGTVGALLALPVPVYFYDNESHFIDTNEDCAVLVDADSATSMIGRTPAAYCDREFSDKIIAIDDAVIQSESMRIVEEIGFRADGSLIQTLSFKLPWYHDDQITGLLGFSVKIDNQSLDDFAARITSVLSTGIMGSSALLHDAYIPKIRIDEACFTKRELDILFHLLRGKTAKKIAEVLLISSRTVENTIARMKEKTHCKTKYELVAKFLHLQK